MIVRLACQRCHFPVTAKTQQAAEHALQEHWIYCYEAIPVGERKDED